MVRVEFVCEMTLVNKQCVRAIWCRVMVEVRSTVLNFP
jgi:hypothetical protein